jgi:hypothetical protein
VQANGEYGVSDDVVWYMGRGMVSRHAALCAPLARTDDCATGAHGYLLVYDCRMQYGCIGSAHVYAVDE